MAAIRNAILIVIVLTGLSPTCKAQRPTLLRQNFLRTSNSSLFTGLLEFFSNLSDKNNTSAKSLVQLLFPFRQQGTNSHLTDVFKDPNVGATLMQVSKYISNILGNIQSNNLTDVFRLLPGFEGSTGTNESSGEDQCTADFNRVLSGITEKENWALKMLDAVGKPGSGILKGTTNFVGDYDECLEIESTATQEFESDHVITGSYCVLSFKAPIFSVKLYNMDVPIEWHICVPKSCGPEDISRTIRKVPITRFNITLMAVDCKTPKSVADDKSAIAALTIVALIGALSLIGTLYDVITAELLQRRSSFKLKPTQSNGQLGPAAFTEESIDTICYDDRKVFMVDDSVMTVKKVHETNGAMNGLQTSNVDMDDVSREAAAGLGRKLLLCFSILKNTEKILGTGTAGGNLGCLHGIRVLSMGWVILGHALMWGIKSARNPIDLWKMQTTFTFQAILNATLSVDTFFFMSGCLVTYLFLRQTEKVGRITCRNMVLYFVHRYWRLTPVYMITVMVYACISGYMTDGPMDKTILDRENCYSNWWTNLLYINNVYKADQPCMGWSWYLANDMQFYIVAPLALVPLALGFTMVGIPVIAAFIITHIVSTACIESDINGSFFFNPQRYMLEVYVRPYCRVGPFAIGMILGYILFKTKCKARIPRYAQLIGWPITIIIALLCTYVTYDEHAPSATPWDKSARAAFEALFRPGWALAVGWVVLVCCTGHGGIVNTILSWKAWIPLGRLTYAAYLIHLIVLTVVESNKHALTYSTITSLSYNFLGTFVISYAAAYLFSVLVEAPCLALEKVVLKR